MKPLDSSFSGDGLFKNNVNGDDELRAVEVDFKGRIVDWDVADPIYMDYADHCGVRDRIETLVMKLVMELRTPPRPQFRGQGSGRLEL